MLETLGHLFSRYYFRNPIFIVGTGRSGTSVLQRALGAHPQIYSVSGESPFISHIGELIHRYEYNEIKDYYVQSLQFPKEYLYASFRRLTLESAVGGKDRLFFNLFKSLIRHRISLFNNRYWCAKTFPTFTSYQGIMTLFPNAKFIYIVRNGIEVVHSRTRFAGFSQKEFTVQCHTWAQSVSKYDYLTDVTNAMHIRHENLLAEPRPVFKQIFTFVGVEDCSKPLDFVTNTIVHPLDKPTEKEVQVKEIFEKRKPPHTNWTFEQREIFGKSCSDAMNKLGYKIPF